MRIHPTVLLDQPYRSFQGAKEPSDIEYRESSFAQNIEIGAGAIIGRGVVLESGVVIDSQCIIEPNATIGENSLLIYRAIVGGETVIGSNCVIGGFVAERCVIGSHSRVFGQIIHRQVDTMQSWDEHDVPEESAILGDYSFVGFGALVIGGVKIGPRAYVAAGAIVTRNVPPGYVVSGVNKLTPVKEWPGALADNPVFLDEQEGR